MHFETEGVERMLVAMVVINVLRNLK